VSGCQLIANNVERCQCANNAEWYQIAGSVERCQLSLVPRLFLPPVFDRLQYANTEGEGLGGVVTCGNVR